MFDGLKEVLIACRELFRSKRAPRGMFRVFSYEMGEGDSEFVKDCHIIEEARGIVEKANSTGTEVFRLYINNDRGDQVE